MCFFYNYIIDLELNPQKHIGESKSIPFNARKKSTLEHKSKLFITLDVKNLRLHLVLWQPSPRQQSPLIRNLHVGKRAQWQSQIISNNIQML